MTFTEVANEEAKSASSAIEIVVGNGRFVRVHDDAFDSVALARVLDILEARS